MIRRPPRSTLDRSSAASDVYKRQVQVLVPNASEPGGAPVAVPVEIGLSDGVNTEIVPVSYTHLRAHETVLDLVCRLLLEKKQHSMTHPTIHLKDTTLTASYL